MGHGTCLLNFPVASHALLNVVAFVSDSESSTYDEKLSRMATEDVVLRVFMDFGHTVRIIISLLPDEVNEWAIFDMGSCPIPIYASGRLCIAGDAAHASSPHHGAGPGLGIEDTLALCHVIDLVAASVKQRGVPKEKAYAAGFRAYETVRREGTHWLVASSRNIGEAYEWQNPEIGQDFDKVFKEIEWPSHKVCYSDMEEMLDQVGFQNQIANSTITKK